MKRTDKNSMLVKSYNFRYKDYKTRKQWLKLGFAVCPSAIGVALYTNGTCQCKKTYYSKLEVFKIENK